MGQHFGHGTGFNATGKKVSEDKISGFPASLSFEG